jgi:YfiH family protein
MTTTHLTTNIHSPEITAIFTTRNGGVSGQTPETAHLNSLNLNFNAEGENRENVAENYRIIAASQGFRVENIFAVRQEHTDRIITVDENTRTAPRIDQICLDESADALVTNIKGILLSVRTADCVPILLYDRINTAVAAIHAGWAGTLAGIGQKTIRRMTELYGTNPADIQAAIGPAIGGCCYEVDFDFHERFRKEYGEKVDKYFTLKSGSKPRCDLKAMNQAFLIAAGIPESSIEVSEYCTCCHPELFYSHRRSGVRRGTMASFIGLKGI